jgi:hypothetical protein
MTIKGLIARVRRIGGYSGVQSAPPIQRIGRKEESAVSRY